MKRLVTIFITLLIFIFLGAAMTAGFAAYWFSSPGPLKEERIIEIPPGTGFTSITQTLIQNEAINYELPFKAMAVWQGNQAKFKAGEYRIPPAASPRQIMEMLVKGESIIHSLTIPEGLTVKEISVLVTADKRLTGNLPENIKEGSLMPDTYYFHRSDSREDLIKRMQDAMTQALNSLWEKRAQNLPFQTPEEALVLATVVEKETGLDDERGRVAAVFVNRLRLGMPLQSDPTVVYGIERQDGPMNRPLLRRDLKRDHPYNTYIHSGLPKGPICNPGKESLEATLNPPFTNELYFVATGTGGHHFATNLKEHNANVARYRSQLRAQREDAANE